MKEQNREFNIVKTGAFLYNELVECDIRIIFSKVRYGTGDYEDSPEFANDSVQDTYYLEYGSTTQRGVYNAGNAGFSSIEEAKKEVTFPQSQYHFKDEISMLSRQLGECHWRQII